MLPNPVHDPVQLIFWCLRTEDEYVPSNGYQEGYLVGVIALKGLDVNKIGLSNDSKWLQNHNKNKKALNLYCRGCY